MVGFNISQDDDRPDLIFSGIQFKIDHALPEDLRTKARQALVRGGGEEAEIWSEATLILTETIDIPAIKDLDRERVVLVTPIWLEHSVKHNKRMESKYYSPDPAKFMSGVIAACNDDLPRNDVEALSGAMFAYGGQWKYAFTKDVTHFFAMAPTGDKYTMAMQVKNRMGLEVIVPAWFQDSQHLQQKIPTGPYSFPSPVIFKPLASLQVPGGDPPTEQIGDRLKMAADSAEKNSLYRTLLEAYGDKQPKGVKKNTDVWKSQRVLVSDDLDVGEDVRISVEDSIRRNGGHIVTEIANAQVLICKFRSGREYEEAVERDITIGSLAWAFYVGQVERVTRPLDQLLHFPVPKGPIKGFENHQITITNYTGDSREYVKKLIMTMGARFTANFSQKNTLVIAAHTSGTKVEKAVSWSIPVVNHTWLEDCFLEWKNLSLGGTGIAKKYSHFPPGVNFMHMLGERGFMGFEDLDPRRIGIDSSQETATSSNGQPIAPPNGDGPVPHRNDARSALQQASELDTKERNTVVEPMDVEVEHDVISKPAPQPATRRAQHETPEETPPPRPSSSSKAAPRNSQPRKDTPPQRKRSIPEPEPANSTDDDSLPDPSALTSRKMNGHASPQAERRKNAPVVKGSNTAKKSKHFSKPPASTTSTDPEEDDLDRPSPPRRKQPRMPSPDMPSPRSVRPTKSMPGTARPPTISPDHTAEDLPARSRVQNGSKATAHASPLRRTASEASPLSKPSPTSTSRKATSPLKKGRVIEPASSEEDEDEEEPRSRRRASPPHSPTTRSQTRSGKVAVAPSRSPSLSSEEEEAPRSARRTRTTSQESRPAPSKKPPKSPFKPASADIYGGARRNGATMGVSSSEEEEPKSTRRTHTESQESRAGPSKQTPKESPLKPSSADIYGGARPRRGAAMAAEAKLHDEIMPDVMRYQKDMRTSGGDPKRFKMEFERSSGSKKRGRPSKGDSDEEHRAAEKKAGEGSKSKGRAATRPLKSSLKGKNKMVESDEDEESGVEAIESRSRSDEESEEERPKPSKKVRLASPRPVSSSVETSTTMKMDQQPKILTTMVELSESQKRAIEKMRGKLASSANDCTILVTEKITRTVKFLLALALGRPIVGKNWIESSLKAKKWLDADSFLLNDPINEKKHAFKLRDAMRRATGKTRLFTGHTFYITPNAGLDFETLRSIIQANGGKATIEWKPKTLTGKNNRAFPPPNVVISSVADRHKWVLLHHSYIHLAIYTQELILQSALTQSVDWLTHRVEDSVAPLARLGGVA